MFRRYSRYKILCFMRLIVDGDGRYDCGHRIPRVHGLRESESMVHDYFDLGSHVRRSIWQPISCSQMTLKRTLLCTWLCHCHFWICFLTSFLIWKKWGLSANHILLMGFLPKEIPEKSSFKTPALGALVRMWCYSLRSTKMATQTATNTNSFLAPQ